MITTKKFKELWNKEQKEYSYMIYNQDGISIIALDNKDEAIQMAEYMTRYHNTGQKFIVKKNS
jgi:hypothetical protein